MIFVMRWSTQQLYFINAISVLDVFLISSNYARNHTFSMCLHFARDDFKKVIEVLLTMCSDLLYFRYSEENPILLTITDLYGFRLILAYKMMGPRLKELHLNL